MTKWLLFVEKRKAVVDFVRVDLWVWVAEVLVFGFPLVLQVELLETGLLLLIFFFLLFKFLLLLLLDRQLLPPLFQLLITHPLLLHFFVLCPLPRLFSPLSLLLCFESFFLLVLLLE